MNERLVPIDVDVDFEWNLDALLHCYVLRVNAIPAPRALDGRFEADS
jgi:hypothetical protein